MPSEGLLARLPLSLHCRPPGLVAGAAGQTSRPFYGLLFLIRRAGRQDRVSLSRLSDEAASRPLQGRINSCAAMEGHMRLECCPVQTGTTAGGAAPQWCWQQEFPRLPREERACWAQCFVYVFEFLFDFVFHHRIRNERQGCGLVPPQASGQLLFP